MGDGFGRQRPQVAQSVVGNIELMLSSKQHLLAISLPPSRRMLQI